MEENTQITEASGEPKQMSPMQNAILTAKILIAAGGVVGFLWMLDRIVNKS